MRGHAGLSMLDVMPKKSLQLAAALSPPAVDKRIDILRGIGRSGSISQAARDAGVSYKAAWQALDTLTNLAGVPLVDRAVGGAGGGGAGLTDAGRQLIAAAAAVEAARAQALARLAPGSAVASVASQLALRTSMRNQLPGQVQHLRTVGRVVSVTVALADGTLLVSRITRESGELLGLAAGRAVLVLCKATAVGVSGSAPGASGGAPINALAGTAARIARAAGGDEVALQLAGGLQLVGFAPPGSKLRLGQAVWATVEPSALVLALT